MLDAAASHAIFGERNRLHRDVLADATTHYLKEPGLNLNAGPQQQSRQRLENPEPSSPGSCFFGFGR